MISCTKLVIVSYVVWTIVVTVMGSPELKQDIAILFILLMFWALAEDLKCYLGNRQR